MPLVVCPDCKKHVSDQARNCVACGYPIRAKKEYLGIRAVLCLIVAAIGSYLVLQGAAMPGAVGFGLFMLATAGLVFLTILWKAFIN